MESKELKKTRLKPDERIKRQSIIKKYKSEEKELKEKVVSFRLTSSEVIELEREMANAGIKNKGQFIKAVVFKRTVKVVKTDSSLAAYVTMLNNLQAQYRAIGNNYNQATKAIHATFSEKKSLAFLYKLEQATKELIAVNNEIKQLTKKLEQEWLQK